MAYSEFYCDASTGANVNGGSDAGSASMSDAAGTGAYSSVTHQYTSVATNGTVAIGQFISVYSGAATVAAFTSRITAVSGGSGSVWVITCSTTAISGTEPTTGSTYKAKVGGAWKGPNAAENFPLGYAKNAMVNAAGDIPRINYKGGTTYSVTAAITHNVVGPMRHEGYTTSVGDGGRATIDGGTSGTSYVVLSSNGTMNQFANLILQNNGATGSADLTAFSGTLQVFEGCTFNSSRGNGGVSTAVALFIECEAYACNASNTAATGGFKATAAGTTFIRCDAHDNTGSNTSGFIATSSVTFINCIADTNGQYNFSCTTNGGLYVLHQCTSYNGTSDGASFGDVSAAYSAENCILLSNRFGLNYGAVDTAANRSYVRVVNCGFQGNSNGQTNGTIQPTSGTITFGAAPTVDAANGNFALVGASGGNAAGRGTFVQAAGSYSKTSVSYPDVGAVQNAANNPVGGSLIVGQAVRRSSSM